jgi:hypothetical protein
MKSILMVTGMLLLWSPTASAEQASGPAPPAADATSDGAPDATTDDRMHLDVEMHAGLAISLGATVTLTLPTFGRPACTIRLLHTALELE